MSETINRYQLCNEQAEAAKKKHRESAAEKGYCWFDFHWHYDQMSLLLEDYHLIDNVSRPTESRAIQHVYEAAYVRRHTGELSEFDDEMWLVYFKDLELRIQWRNSRVYNAEIAEKLGLRPERVAMVLRRLDAVVEAREKLGLPVIPPVPMRYLYAQRRVNRLAKEKRVRIAA